MTISDSNHSVSIATADAWAREVGARLRAARIAERWSLNGIERATCGLLKGGVLGAYERGDRAMTLQRLKLAADCIGADVTVLLPPSDRTPATETAGNMIRSASANPDGTITIVLDPSGNLLA